MAVAQELLSAREVETRLGIRETTRKRLIRDGWLPEGRKLYGCTRWFSRDVDRVLFLLEQGDILGAPGGAAGRRGARPKKRPKRPLNRPAEEA